MQFIAVFSHEGVDYGALVDTSGKGTATVKRDVDSSVAQKDGVKQIIGKSGVFILHTRKDSSKLLWDCVGGRLNGTGKLLDTNDPGFEYHMSELVDVLKNAAEAYYNADESSLSDNEYDRFFDELTELERISGVVLPGSVTLGVGAAVVSKLTKVKHASPMLSLDKTKDKEVLAEVLRNHSGIMSWKLDGLTLVVTYEQGKLVQAVTRGDGRTGEDVTHIAPHIKGLPRKLKGHTGNLVVRGECVISFDEFARINSNLSADEAYKHPRNLASGSLRQLDAAVAAERGLEFYLFDVVSGMESFTSYFEILRDAEYYGFSVVERKLVDSPKHVDGVVEQFRKKVEKFALPTDGLVLRIEDISFGESLGSTSHAPRNAMAFKWADDIKTTKMLGIDWSVSRTGAITPVALFEPVEIDGVTVQRASLSNVSLFEGLELGVGDTVEVYRANMVIPQVCDNLTRSGGIPIPEACPVCGGKAIISQPKDSKVLVCTNADCSAKNVGKFVHFVKREAMNIEGVSEKSIADLVSAGFIRNYSDFYQLKQKPEIKTLDGWGETSYQKLCYAVESSRNTTLARFIYSLGIDGVGRTASRDLSDKLGSLDNFLNASVSDLTSVQGVGSVMAADISSFTSKNADWVRELAKELTFSQTTPIASGGSGVASGGSSVLAGKSICITGGVTYFSNRGEFQDWVRSHGGKSVGSVSKNTDYLVNNDFASNSTKNRTAKSLGVEILSEQAFMDLVTRLGG